MIPGYVKCPRCHAVLPSAARSRRASLAPGGTAIEPRAFPVVPALAGALALGVVLLLVLEGGATRKPAPAAGAVPATAAAGPGAVPGPASGPGVGAASGAPPGGAPGALGAPAAAPGAGATAAAVPAPPLQPPPPRPLDIPAATGPSPTSVADELERALGQQRLWSRVAASGDRVDVRSGSCADPAMGPMIDAARAALRGVGLTRLRCLAQSGAVVFERDL